MTDETPPAWTLGPNMIALKAALAPLGSLVAENVRRPNAHIIEAAEAATGLTAGPSESLEDFAGRCLAKLAK